MTSTSPTAALDLMLTRCWDERQELGRWLAGQGQEAPEIVRSVVFEASCEIEDHIFGAKVTTPAGLAVKAALLHLWLKDGVLDQVPKLAAAIVRDVRRIVPATPANLGGAS